jgi:outer membrane protein
MKKLIVAMLAALAFTVSANASAAEIAVVDLQTVLKNSSEVQKIRQNLKEKFSDKRQALQKAQTNLQSLMKKYKKNKSVMTSKKKEALEDKIDNARQRVQSLQSDFQRQYISAQNEQLSSFVDKVKERVKKIAKSKGYDLVLEQNSVAYASDDMDITDMVLDKINNN